jgi:hypothetical protein
MIYGINQIALLLNLGLPVQSTLPITDLICDGFRNSNSFKLLVKPSFFSTFRIPLPITD